MPFSSTVRSTRTPIKRVLRQFRSNALTVDRETANNDEPCLTGSSGRGGNRFNKLAAPCVCRTAAHPEREVEDAEHSSDGYRDWPSVKTEQGEADRPYEGSAPQAPESGVMCHPIWHSCLGHRESMVRRRDGRATERQFGTHSLRRTAVSAFAEHSPTDGDAEADRKKRGHHHGDEEEHRQHRIEEHDRDRTSRLPIGSYSGDLSSGGRDIPVIGVGLGVQPVSRARLSRRWL